MRKMSFYPDKFFKEDPVTRSIVMTVVKERLSSGNDSNLHTLSLHVTDDAQKISKLSCLVAEALSEIEKIKTTEDVSE